MKRRGVVAALAVVLCLACSWSSGLIVANTTDGPLTIRARYEYDLVMSGTLPVRLAPVGAMGTVTAWHVAPAGLVVADTTARTLELILPAGTAAEIGSASVCGSPITCDHFGLVSLELSGTAGSFAAERGALRAAFSVQSRFDWILWYPTGAHGFWQNLRPKQAGMFALALVVAGCAIWTAILVARTPMPRRWGWAAVALLGVGRVAINWTTGETAVNLLSLPVIGASIGRPDEIGPWILAFSFPVGAIVALIRRDLVLDRQRREAALPDETPHGSSEHA